MRRSRLDDGALRVLGLAVLRGHSVCLLYAATAGGLAMVGCHDARRQSPLDPELTPAVSVMAAMDDTAAD